MVNVSQDADVPDVSSVFLQVNHLIQTVEHHGPLFPVTKHQVSVTQGARPKIRA